jgi:hypothetical protein
MHIGFGRAIGPWVGEFINDFLYTATRKMMFCKDITVAVRKIFLGHDERTAYHSRTRIAQKTRKMDWS